MTRKPLISVRLNADDHAFIAEHLPARRRSEFIQRAVANAVKGLRAMREIQTVRSTDGNLGAPRWATILDQYVDKDVPR